MLERRDDNSGQLVELGASGTIMAHDVKEALRLVGTAERLVVTVTPDFDGYMAELVGGLQHACSDGQAGRCALVVPHGMGKEARMRGESSAFRVFEARETAEQWLMA